MLEFSFRTGSRSSLVRASSNRFNRFQPVVASLDHFQMLDRWCPLDVLFNMRKAWHVLQDVV